jgi:hypothetical protein
MTIRVVEENLDYFFQKRNQLYFYLKLILLKFILTQREYPCRNLNMLWKRLITPRTNWKLFTLQYFNLFKIFQESIY